MSLLVDLTGGYPLFTGTYGLDPRVPFTVTLAGRDYPIDLAKYRHNGLAKFREGVVTSGEPNDQLFDSQGAWWRYRFDFSHGAGQRVADLDKDADPARFHRSRGFDPWTKYEACMLNSVDVVLDVVGADISMIATALHVFVGDGTTVKRSADLVSWTTITGLTGTVLCLTTDGTNVYAGTSTGIFTIGPSSSSAALFTTAVPTGDITNIAFVANRLLAGDDNVLVEVGTSALDPIFTHFQAAFRWTSIFQVGSRIYVGGFAGNRSELYAITTLSDGSLAIEAEATSFFSNELLRGGTSYGGSVILITSRGVRFAIQSADASLQYGPLIDAPGDVECVCTEGRFGWFGWTAFIDGGRGLGRLALDTFTDTLQPAYASDVWDDAASGNVVACVRFGGRTLFATANGNVYGSVIDSWVTEAWLEFGELYFGTIEDKSLSEMKARVEALGAGESVGLELFDPEGVSLGDALSTSVGAEEIILDLQGAIVNHATGRVTVMGNGDSQVCLRHWRARAYPVAPAVEEWLVPLIIRSGVIVSDGEGQILALDPWTCVQELLQIWRDGAITVYREGDHAQHVRIDNLEHDAGDWRDGADWFETTCTVRLLST